MADKPLPTQDELRQLLDYNPDTGILTWKARQASTRGQRAFNARRAGKPAFIHLGNRGYLTGRINRRLFPAHRVIFALTHGYWPDNVDHINGSRTDNRINNLRAASHAENVRNGARHKKRANGAKYKGVYLQKGGSGWFAQICVNRRKITLGTFKTQEDAARAYNRAAVEYHGTFARLNVVEVSE